MVQVFISHSSEDTEIATAISDLLTRALGLSTDSIRCSSADGYRFDAGEQVSKKILNEVLETKVLIGMISPASAGS